MRWLTLTEAALGVTGLLFLVLTFVFAARAWIPTIGMQRAQATVTEIDPRMDAAGDLSYFPHLRFRTHDGQLREVIAARGGDLEDYTPGEIVPVLYASAQPQRILIASVTRLYRAPLEAGVVAAILLDVGLVLRRRRVRGKSRSRRAFLR